jgi:hypothetical protein
VSEEWRTLKLGKLQQESRYEVSSLGRVRNRETQCPLKTFFRPNRNGDLYEKICLRVGGRRKNFLVHRLVADAFLPDPKPEVNHIDCNTLNNCWENLEWATREENEAHKRFMEATA